MSKNGEFIQSTTNCAGVNTYPLLFDTGERAAYMSKAVNRSVYKGYNDTRPPFVEFEIKFQSTEDEYVFRNAAISGMKFYEGEARLFSSFLIVAVGDRIMAGYLRVNSIEFLTIYKGIDPQWHHAFFCQALNILTYNDGKNPGLYWTGKPTEPMKPIYESAYSDPNFGFPISNVSVFAFGRIFPCTPNNIVYASDYIYAQGLSIEQRESVLSFRESTYPSSGDGFGSPSAMGSISGIIAVPQANTLNGYGDILVACRNGVFSIAPNRKVRNEWTNDPEMQKSVLLGKGCVAHNSIIIFNGQIFYRDSNNDMSSMNQDISTYQQGQGFNAISREVERYTNYDANSDDIQYASSTVTNNRLLSSVCHRKEPSISMGIHRYGMGMVSACLQKKGATAFMSWEGLWTGLRPTAMVVSNAGNIKQTIIASYASDKQNRLYYLNELGRGDDVSNREHRVIESKFSYSSMFSDVGDASGIIRKRLNKIEAIMLKSNPVSVTVTYSSDLKDSFFPAVVQLTEVTGCGFTTARILTDDISKGNSGYMFTINFKVEGVAQFVKITSAASVLNKEGFENTKCESNDSGELSKCPPFEECKYDYEFSYLL